MADNKDLSIEQILAACRKQDGEGGGAAPPEEPAAKAESAESKPAEPATPSPANAVKADAKSMSVEDMLAAARAEKAGGGSPAKSEPAKGEAAASKASATPAKKPGEMSVADMLAAARAEKQGPAKSEPAAKKAAPKPAAAKPAAKADKPAAAAPAGPKDTASILAAARKGAKPGPVSKQEAAAAKSASGPVKAKPAVPPMPEKPAYARPAATAAASAEDRRGFFATVGGYLLGSSLAIGFTSLAITQLLWVLGLARFIFPNILTEPPTRFRVGFPDDLAPGQVQTKFKAQFGIWLVRDEYEGQPQIYALRSVCTHLGCTPNWLEGEQKFKCPCHGSGFYKDGINFEGPAPRPLERYAISVAADGQLEVDKSRKFNQELGQWKDSASYVPV